MSARQGWFPLLSLCWGDLTGPAGDDQAEHEAFSQPPAPVPPHHPALPGQEGVAGTNSAQLQYEVKI